MQCDEEDHGYYLDLAVRSIGNLKLTLKIQMR
jgi:hypothetical protein